MNEMSLKIDYFEEVLYHLNEWYKEKNPDKQGNDLSILKVMKLLFFMSGAVEKNDLFDTFNKFQAWQYGHVEADIYNYYFQQDGVFVNFKIDRNKLQNIIPDYLPNINDDISEKIEKNINKLKEENPDLISYNAFRLVEISHSYHSWDMYYNRLQKRYEDIDKKILIHEPRYYK